MRFVFLHGGPGFNSAPEHTILGPLFERAGCEITFWNEPSRQRPDGDPFVEDRAFEHWIRAAERCVLRAAGTGRVHVIAHCATMHAAVDIARRHAHLIESLVLVSPSPDLLATFRNVLRLAQEDLADGQPAVASAIGACLARTRAVPDKAMREGLQHTLQDNRLFTHYFADRTQYEAMLAVTAGPEVQFDVESFFAVLAGLGPFATARLMGSPLAMPVLTLFGVADPVAPYQHQQELMQAALPHGPIELVDGGGHYLHLDRPRHFVDRVIAWAASCGHRPGS